MTSLTSGMQPKWRLKEGVAGGWMSGRGGELAHLALRIPFVLKRQIGGAIWTVKHAMGDLFDTMYGSTWGASVCLTLCVQLYAPAHVNSAVFAHANYSDGPIGDSGFVVVFVLQPDDHVSLPSMYVLHNESSRNFCFLCLRPVRSFTYRPRCIDRQHIMCLLLH